MAQQPPVQQPGAPAAWTPPPAYPPAGYAAAPRYAGFWIRVVAYIIDAIIMGILAVTVIGIIVAIPYMPVMWWKKGSTLGQMAFGLRVVRAVDGGPISGSAAFIRFIGIYVSAICLYLGLIWVAFEPRKRGWHDMMAGTVVIHTK
ncbi:MAG: RDD family protein [Candidatus Limnocylindrales bacterium]